MALSTTLLLAVLGGMTYEAAARDHSLTRTAVERRVKALVLRLIREVGVEGLNESRAMFVGKLRDHRVAIESALSRLVVVRVGPKTTKPMVLSDDDIRHALRRVRLRTPTPERDVAMVWILLATGLRPLEVARLEVADYLNEDGSVRVQSEVREGVALNHRRRPLYFSSALYFSSQAVRDAIDAYLATRSPQGGGGRTAHGAWAMPHRGLDPKSALFLSDEDRPFLVETIPTTSGTRSLCQEIHYVYRKIFRRIGIPGLTAQNVRYTVVDRLARRGADGTQIGELLGVRALRRSEEHT